MTTTAKRQLTAAQIRIIRGKAKKPNTVAAPANDVVAEVRKTLPDNAIPVHLDVSSAPITHDATQRGIDRVVVGSEDRQFVAYGQIANVIVETARIDGYAVISGDRMKIIGIRSGDFVINEHGDDWALPASNEQLDEAA